MSTSNSLPHSVTTEHEQNNHVLSNLYNFFRFPENENQIEKAKLRWLIRLRWVAIILFFLLSVPGYLLGVLNSTSLVLFIGIIGFLLIFNLLTQFAFAENKKSIGPVFICFQLASDLVALAALLAVSGGFRNPFIALFLINAALGGLLIRGRLAWPFILLCHAFLIALQILFVLDTPNLNQKMISVLISTSHILLMGIWLVMRSIGSYLERHFEQQTLTRVKFEKQDRLRALGALAAGFSHEFASPLNAAKLRLERIERLLSNSDVNLSLKDQIKECLRDTQLSLKNCETVIQAMNASQLDVRDYQIKSFNLNDFINDVADSWKEENSTAQLHVTITEPIIVQASAINLAQVIINLLDNAYQAQPEGLISLVIKTTNRWINISIEDHGPGFSSDMLVRRGEPFATTKLHGTGLGLYVSEIFAQSLDGYLRIENKSDFSGAIVTLSWPLHLERVFR